jgi:hypothetical protein
MSWTVKGAGVFRPSNVCLDYGRDTTIFRDASILPYNSSVS